MSNQQPLHIAVLLDDFFPASGGIGRSAQTQIDELTKLGHKVTLFAPKHLLQKPDNCETVVIPSLYLPKAPSHTCTLKFGRRLAQKIHNKYDFDAVHSHTERGALILAAKIAKKQGIPHVHTFHANIAGTHATAPILSAFASALYATLINWVLAGVTARRHSGNITMSHFSQKSWFQRLDWRSLARIASRVDHFITPSDFMQEAIVEGLPNYHEQGHIIPTGVNSQFLEELESYPESSKIDGVIRFYSIGRLSREKRIDVLIQAFNQANIPNSELHIVGRGDQLLSLKRMSIDNASIIFHSHTTSLTDLAQHYRSADVFILTSYGFDNQPITLVEAAASGLPIIYCDPQLTVGVTKHNSLLTESPDASGIATALKQMIDPDLRNSLAAASKQVAPSLSAPVMAESLVNLYSPTHFNQSKSYLTQ